MKQPVSVGILVAVLIGGVLGGCGYQLRTWDLAGAIESVALTANPRNPIAEPLRSAFQGAGVRIVDAGDADLIVELLDDRSSRRSISVTANARAAEYEASVGVRYRAVTAAGDELIAPRWLSASRVFEVDRGNPVATNQEQALLEREMVSELVGQIIRSINAAIARRPALAGQADAD